MSALGKKKASAFRAECRKSSEIFAWGIGHCHLSLKDLQERSRVNVFQSRYGIISLSLKWLKEWKAVSDQQPVAVVCTD